MQDILELRRAFIFEDLTESEVETVSSIVEWRTCPADTCLVEAGTLDRSLFVVVNGSVRIVKRDSSGDENPIAEVLPGQHLGEVTFVGGGYRTATAITNEPTELMVLDPEVFAKLSDAHPTIAFKVALSLLRLLCARLRNTDTWLFELMSARSGTG